MKFLRLNFFYTFSILFISQTIISQECPYKSYDSLINVGENYFKLNKRRDGQTYYKLAFQTSVFPKGEDLSFALYKARALKDDTWAFELAEKLAKGGVPQRFFFQFKSEKWYQKFEQNFENYLKFFHENFNHELRSELILLLDKDKIRTDRYHSWRTREIEMSLDDLINEAKAVLVDFEKIIAEYGFPNEQMVGYNYVKRINKIESYELNALIVHMYQRGVRLFEDSMAELVCSGSLPAGFQNTIKKVYGFSETLGIENEMKARYKKFRGNQ